MARENVMISVGGLRLGNPKTITKIIGDLQNDYGNVDFYGMAYEQIKQGQISVTEKNSAKTDRWLRSKLPDSFFNRAACGTAPVSMLDIFKRVVSGPTGDGKTSFDSLIVMASQNTRFWHPERHESREKLANIIRQNKTRVVILVARQPGQTGEGFDTLFYPFTNAAVQVNGVAHLFDPMGPEREGIINIAWRVSRGLLPTRRVIEQPVAHPSVVQFYNKCAQAFVCSR